MIPLQINRVTLNAEKRGQVNLVSARFLFLEGLMRLSINAKGG